MAKVNIKAACLCVLFQCLFLAAFSQKTLVNEDESRMYQRGIELFDKGRYGVAQKHFQMYAARTREREQRINAEYYAGVCAMELFNPDAITLLNSVRLRYPEHPKANLAAFQLARYFYRGKDNKSSVKYLNLVNVSALTPEQAAEFWFIKGYVNFKTEQFEESKAAFSNIKDKPSKYYDPANYYYGYVAYRQNNYDEALEHFNRISKSRTFGPLSQVYVSQIYFARKQYRQVISFADTISNKEIINDVAGMVGQSWFNLEEYEKALPYLERFAASSAGRTRPDSYRLGYAWYRTGNCEKAIEQFTQLVDEKDTTAQFSYYHLGVCFLKAKDKKPAARLAFEKAAALKFDPAVTEAASYNHAKLSYELGFQQVALTSLAAFINAFPASKYADEARSSLGDLLMSTRNYKDAIRIIESVKNPGPEGQAAFQRVCYYRAEELYLNADYAGAEELFRKSLQFQHDKKLHALAMFWIGELSYKQGKYQQALTSIDQFQGTNEAKDTRFHPLSWYNKGYAELKLEDYAAAISAFTTFVATDHAQASPELFTDATMRIADCHFVLREYDKAVAGYNVIVDRKLNGSDYALYQKAMIHGVQNRFSDKIAALEQLRRNHPRSAYIDDAVFEIANVNLQTENYDAAISGFQSIITDYPRSMYIRKAMLNKGLAAYNTGKDEQALSDFKTLITSYSASDEARQALVVVRNIFVSKGESDAYLEFIKVLPNVVVSPTFQDSVTYESAFNSYKNGDCAKAARSFGNYISRFPGGFFILKANYYKAECDFKSRNYDSALVHYEFVATFNRNDFTEKSTRQTAVLYFMKKNYEKAFEYYSILERIAGTGDNVSVALLGQMKSGSLLGRTDTAAQVSFRYLNAPMPQKDGLVEAHMNIARYYMNHAQPDSAQQHFRYVLNETRNALAAESKFNIALIYFLKNDLKTARKEVFALNDNYPSYEYWTARGFILLADVYAAEKDYFQAKATLQSIIENYEGADLVAMAREKLAKVIEAEEALKPKTAPEPEKEVGQ